VASFCLTESDSLLRPLLRRLDCALCHKGLLARVAGSSLWVLGIYATALVRCGPSSGILIHDTPSRDVAHPSLLDVVRSVETSQRQLEAADLLLVAEVDARGLPDRLLARGTAGLLAGTLTPSMREARQQVRQPRALGRRSPASVAWVVHHSSGGSSATAPAAGSPPTNKPSP
jgi:hypothetical protein